MFDIKLSQLGENVNGTAVSGVSWSLNAIIAILLFLYSCFFGYVLYDVLCKKDHSNIYYLAFAIFFVVPLVIFLNITYYMLNDPIDFYWYDIIIYSIQVILMLLVYCIEDLLSIPGGVYLFLFVLSLLLLCIYHFGYKIKYPKDDTIEDNN
jgi:hypothetical protein